MIWLWKTWNHNLRTPSWHQCYFHFSFPRKRPLKQHLSLGSLPFPLFQGETNHSILYILGAWDGHVQTAIFKTDNQQGPILQHRDLCSILSDNLHQKRIWKRIDSYGCITESLCCALETEKAWLINYTPI